MSFPDLAVLTLRDPKSAAQVVLSWNLPREALWTAIALISVVVTILSTLSNMIIPVPPPLNGIVGNPFLYCAIAAGGFIATVYAIYWTGRILGGEGSIEDMMILLLWLQALRAGAQVVVLISLILAPVLASFLVLFIGVATLWVFVHFINAGLRLNSLLRAVGVLFLGAVALMAILTFLLSMIGVSAVGVPLNV
ncbi:hypothetical protein RD1_2690 [Roseobacter denitrificans OCh 114]|uniref:Yip1 domain-containing protein n=2 Tax=Roseobacter denitrificans TaxID=2434 RepID=Q165W1_ROSDO|nr:hypothetical protein RD1_2690 [Roseobacter denitrificans OCh 114]